MAIPTNIKTLLSGNVVEWARIEFKESTDNRTSVPNVLNPEESLSVTEEQILTLIAENPTITSQSLAERYRISRKTVTRVCRLLKEKGIIVREGKTRGKWIILK